MRERKECPACHTKNTTRVFIESERDRIIETRVCVTCGAQWDNEFASMIARNIHESEDNE